MSLVNLPTELLEWITSVITANEQCHLWQCGDRVLNWKLRNGGIKHTHLDWAHAPWIPWPGAFFSSLPNLENILWHAGEFNNICPSLNLEHLPRTLKCLQLYIEDIYYILRRSKVNLSELFPFLERLYLSGADMTEENLKNLPATLKHLFVVSESKICSNTIFRDLPRSLEDLGFIFHIEDEAETGNDLPGGLQSLTIAYLKAKYDWLTKVPKSLKSLSISGLDRSSWTNLPPELEELVLPHPPTFPASALSELHHLKILDVNFANPLSDDGIALLPKSLTQFSNSQSEFTHLALQKIHPNLQDFDARVSVTNADILSLFPAESKHLRLIEDHFSEFLNFVQFPPKVTSLDLDFINDDMCLMLPPTLHHLRVSRGHLTSKGVTQLPSTLMFFTAGLDLFDSNQTLSYFAFVPFIDLTFGDNPTEIAVTSEWLSYLSPKSLIHKTTHHTKVESLTISTGNDFEPSTPYNFEPIFESLPEMCSLTHLTIRLYNKNTVRPSWLRFIPENVIHLEIGCLSAIPTPEEVSKLPKRLRILELRSQAISYDWPVALLESLPRTLSELRINGTLVRTDHNINDDTPPYMMALLEHYNPSNQFVTPLKRFHPEI